MQACDIGLHQKAHELQLLACSMGGILVKELLVKAAQPNAPAHHKQLAAAASGLVFYCTPHMGSWMAAWGWNLRYFGEFARKCLV